MGKILIGANNPGSSSFESSADNMDYHSAGDEYYGVDEFSSVKASGGEVASAAAAADRHEIYYQRERDWENNNNMEVSSHLQNPVVAENFDQTEFQFLTNPDVCLLKRFNEMHNNGMNTYYSSSSMDHHQLHPSMNGTDYSKLFPFLDAAGRDDLSFSSSPKYCSESSDGLLCWPETLVGEHAFLPCKFHLNDVEYDSGIATRICEMNGTWLKSDYTLCSMIPSGHDDDESTSNPNLSINTTVYICGYTLSLCFLFLAIVIFVAFKELHCLRNKIHTQLFLTYIFADTLWIFTNFTGSSQTSSVGESGHVSCITFILVHYFHVTNFFWMFVEGLYLYILVVQTFIADNIKLRTYTMIGWGIPLLILVIWSIAKWLTPHEMNQSLVINDPEFPSTTILCPWLTISYHDWIFKAPVIFVLVGNIIFLFQIMWVLITKLRSAMNPETQQSRKAAKALLVLMPLLGITYLLILTGSKQTPIYENIRALLISTQGFLVALLYCFCNGEVRTAIRHRWERIRDCIGQSSCCGCEIEHAHQMRDCSSPRSRTESIRFYTPNAHEFRKRESSGVSDITTMSSIRGGSLNGSPHIIQTMTVVNKNNSRLSTTIPIPPSSPSPGTTGIAIANWTSPVSVKFHSTTSNDHNNSTIV